MRSRLVMSAGFGIGAGLLVWAAAVVAVLLNAVVPFAWILPAMLIVAAIVFLVDLLVRRES